MKSPKPRNKAQRKVDYKNYDAITMRRNYQEKLWHEIISDALLSGEIITRNYELVYYVVENVGIIGILAYPKNIYIFFYITGASRRYEMSLPDMDTSCKLISAVMVAVNVINQLYKFHNNLIVTGYIKIDL